MHKKLAAIAALLCSVEQSITLAADVPEDTDVTAIRTIVVVGERGMARSDVDRPVPVLDRVHEAVYRLGQVGAGVVPSLLGRAAGSPVESLIGRDDPFESIRQALADGDFDDVIISTLPAEKSGWLRAQLPERIADAARIPVDHVVVEVDAAGVKS